MCRIFMKSRIGKEIDKDMSRNDDGCILIPIVLIWYLLKLAIAIAAYALAAVMTALSLIYLPLMLLVALIKGDSKVIYVSLLMWFALAHEFVQKLFKD